MRHWLVATALMIFGACLSSTSTLAADPAQWDSIAIYNAKATLKTMLRDPASAQFRNVTAYHPASASRVPQIVCGEVNSKNGLGGYSGFQRFVWLPLNAQMKADMKTGSVLIGDSAANLVSLCHDKAS